MRALSVFMSLVLLAGCSDAFPGDTTASDPPASQLEEPPDWLQVFLEYSRRHDFGRRIDVATVNRGAEEVRVSRIWLRADHFVELPPDEKETVLRPGRRVDIKASFGQVADCDAPGPLPVEVVLEATVGEETHFYRWDLSPDVPDGIRAAECEEQLVARAVSVSIGDDWESDGEIVEAVMVFEREEGDEVVTVADIEGLVLFGAAAESRDPAGVLRPGDGALKIPIRIHLARCDEHALSQLPDGIVFRAFVSVGDRPPHVVRVHPPASLEAELWEIVDRCTG